MRVSRCVLVLLLILYVLFCAAPAQSDIVVELPEAVDVGSPFFLRLLGPEAFVGAHLRWQDRQVFVPAEGGEALILLGAPLELDPGAHMLVGEAEVDGRTLVFAREITVRSREFPEQRLTVAGKMVEPDPAILPRINEERRQVREALDRISPSRHWTTPFVRPVGGALSSAFGLRRFFNDQPRAPHRGVDLRGAEGTPVKAFSAGEVILTGDHYFAGKSVYVDHGLGMVTQYIHLSEIAVVRGQKVSPGQILGKVGATGRVTGPHLHFGLSVLAMWVDPLPLLE